MTTQAPHLIALKQIQLVYSTFFFGSMLLAGIASIIVSRLGHAYQVPQGIAAAASYIAIAIVLILISLSQSLPQKKVNRISKEIPLDTRIQEYKKAILPRLIMILFASLAAVIGFLIAENTDLLLLVAISMIFFILNRPSVFKVIKDLNLSPEEEAQLHTKAN